MDILYTYRLCLDMVFECCIGNYNTSHYADRCLNTHEFRSSFTSNKFEFHSVAFTNLQITSSFHIPLLCANATRCIRHLAKEFLPLVFHFKTIRIYFRDVFMSCNTKINITSSARQLLGCRTSYSAGSHAVKDN